MKIRPMSRYMKSLSNEKLAKFLPIQEKGPDGKERTVSVSLFTQEAQKEASRRRRERKAKMTMPVSSFVKAA